MLRTRILNISTGAPLRSASEVAQVVRQNLPGAQIEIGSGLSELEGRDLKNRGRLSIQRAVEELAYQPMYSLEKGISDYIQQYKSFLNSSP